MRKLYFVLLLLTFPALAFAQNLTVGQVHNYSIGDIFERKTTIYNGYFYVVKDTITGKWFSAGMDTVFYERKGTSYSPPTGPGQSPNYSYFRDTISYTSLNSLVLHPMEALCFSSIRDSFCNQCSLQVWERYSVQDTGCFEPRNYRSWYIEGAGGPYYEDNYPAQWAHTIFQLIYYKKGNDSCGVSILTSGSKAINSQPSVMILPGQIVTSETFKDATVYDMKGTCLLKKADCRSIDLSLFSTGIYVVKLVFANGDGQVVKVFVE